MRARDGEVSSDFARLTTLLARVRARVVLEDVGGEAPAVPRADGASLSADGIERPMRLLLRVEEAAEALAIGRSKVYELIRTGQLPCVRIGRLVRISVDDLRALVERSRDGR